VIDDGGRPFRVTSERSSDGYTTKFDDAGRVQVAREHGWDDGISAC